MYRYVSDITLKMENKLIYFQLRKDTDSESQSCEI